MRIFTILLITGLSGLLYAGEASLGPARPETGSRLVLLSPTNGQIAMRDIRLRGMAGSRYSVVEVRNLSLSNTVAVVPVVMGRWQAVLPLAIGRPNRLWIQASHTNGTEPASLPLEITVSSRLDMTRGGLVFLLTAWSVIILLNIFAFVKIFGIRKDKIVEPLEIDTQDD